MMLRGSLDESVQRELGELVIFHESEEWLSDEAVRNKLLLPRW